MPFPDPGAPVTRRPVTQRPVTQRPVTQRPVTQGPAARERQFFSPAGSEYTIAFCTPILHTHLPSMVLDVHSRKTLGQQCCTGTMCRVVRRTDVRRFARDSAYPQVVSAWRRKTQCVCLVCVVVCMCNGNCATHGASRGIQHSQHDIRACE